MGVKRSVEVLAARPTKDLSASPDAGAARTSYDWGYSRQLDRESFPNPPRGSLAGAVGVLRGGLRRDRDRD